MAFSCSVGSCPITAVTAVAENYQRAVRPTPLAEGTIGASVSSMDEMDEDFPLGEGTAETDAIATCPYCGEAVSISIDPGGGESQEYVEDCEVCCNPWKVTVQYSGGAATVSLEPLDG